MQKQIKLNNLKYIMFGLGNSNYELFGGFSRKIRNYLNQLGAKQIYEYGLSDAKI